MGSLTHLASAQRAVADARLVADSTYLYLMAEALDTLSHLVATEKLCEQLARHAGDRDNGEYEGSEHA